MTGTSEERRWVCVVSSDPAEGCTERYQDHHTFLLGCGYVDAVPAPLPPEPGVQGKAPELAAQLNEQRRQSYNAEAVRTRPPAPSVPLPVELAPLGIEQTHASLMRLGNELLAEGRTDDASAVLVAAGYIDASVRSARARLLATEGGES